MSKTDQGRLATIDQAVQAHVQSAPGATPSASAARTASALDVARISHDMRSPLSGVLGLTSMLLMSDLDERQRQLASLTRSSAESLLVMVNDIVDLARSEQGRLDARLSRVDLWALVQEQVELCRLHVGSRPLGVLLHLAPDVPRWIETDGDKLRRVLHNYLSNALKFSRRGDITVCVEAITQAPARGLRIDVRDNGAGIAEADQPGIFGEFYQAGAGVAQAGASSGLGLAVARRLIEALGGEVGFESTLGQGSRFWFIVPLRPA